MDGESTPVSSGGTGPAGDAPQDEPAIDDEEAPGAVEGRVLDSAGAPVAGATVAVAASTRPTRDIAAMTTADGRFRLGSLLPGSYDIEARQGTLAGTVQVVVEAGVPASVEIRLGGR
ncbi:MAG: carboxypeptidase-like regulatory domain-containing protein [Mycetocola sp.]